MVGGSDGGTALHVVLYVLGFATVPPLEALMISRAFGLSNFATILGTGFMFETIAIFFSPLVAGSIFDNTGSYDDALLLYAICAAASAVIFVAASRVRQPLQARLPASGHEELKARSRQAASVGRPYGVWVSWDGRGERI